MSLGGFAKKDLNLARAVVERVRFSSEDTEGSAIEIQVRPTFH